jgi:hypothetical protein
MFGGFLPPVDGFWLNGTIGTVAQVEKYRPICGSIDGFYGRIVVIIVLVVIVVVSSMARAPSCLIVVVDAATFSSIVFFFFALQESCCCCCCAVVVSYWINQDIPMNGYLPRNNCYHCQKIKIAARLISILIKQPPILL